MDKKFNGFSDEFGDACGVNDSVDFVSAGESPIYEVLQEQKQVLVKVPKKSGFMTYKPAFTIPGGDSVSQHWRNGKPLRRGVFLNTHFYGISNANLDKNIIATVRIVKKTMPNSREFIMLDVIHTPDTLPTHDMKFPKITGKGIEIIGTDQEIEFRERTKREVTV